jgi:hypothetical protein
MAIDSPLMRSPSEEASRQFELNKQDAAAVLELQRRLADEQASIDARRIEDLLKDRVATATDIATQTNDANATSVQMQRDAAAKALADAMNFASFQQSAQMRTLNELREQQRQAQQAQFSSQMAAAAQAAARAAEVRRYNEGRQKFITEAKGTIDDTFRQFDDSFYQDFKDKFLAYYAPKLEKSFGDASRDMTLKFADNANLNSSAAARSFGELTEAKAEAQAGVAAKAEEGSRSLQADILRQRNDALASVFNAADTGQSLPDGLDADSGLKNISTRINDVTRGIKDNVNNYRAPNPNSLPDALSGFRDALANVRRPATTFSRAGGYTPSSSNSAYTVA